MNTLLLVEHLSSVEEYRHIKSINLVREIMIALMENKNYIHPFVLIL